MSSSSGIHGVCNGLLGNNLPHPTEVVQMYKSNGITAMRIYSPDTPTLTALRGSGIAVIMDVGNGQVRNLATNVNAATDWVRTHIQAWPNVRFRYIAVGNELPDSDFGLILPAMENVHKAIEAAGLANDIKISTAVMMSVLGDSTFPPSRGVFRTAIQHAIVPIAQFLARTNSALLVNVYPYFAYKYTPSINLDYATFRPGPTAVHDENGLVYTNLFSAMVDTVYAALEKSGNANVRIVVSETGWPSAGAADTASGATMENARSFNQGVIDNVKVGTPKRPGPLETYVFAMFNENLKPGDPTEQHFGLFNPDKTPVYTIRFPKE
ncbi:glycoside hydrolase [Cladochytrium replicatum]|nr:glycoside hydrolase [Cladochytrium replicatum]